MNKIRTRFAPSPTGYLHIGGLRTALFNYLWTQKNRGQFLLRIEDTDQERYVQGAEEKLIATLENIGLKPNQKPLTQSSRLKIYQKIAEELVKKENGIYKNLSTLQLTAV